jgi:Uma2 family endonuclease
MSPAAPLPAQPPDVTDKDFLVWELLLKGRPPSAFTQADLDALPESSGYRFELLDGILIVSPSPNLAHQRLVAQLHLLLGRDCPADCEVLFAPFDLKPNVERTFQPDLFVARSADFDEKMLTRAAPLLVVEVRSPSTGLYDRTAKRAVYAEWGVPGYWLADPQVPSVTVLELDRAGRYREQAMVHAGESVQLVVPYPLTLSLP